MNTKKYLFNNKCWDLVYAKMWDKASDRLDKQVGKEAYWQVYDQVWEKVWNTVGATIYLNVGSQLEKKYNYYEFNKK